MHCIIFSVTILVLSEFQVSRCQTVNVGGQRPSDNNAQPKFGFRPFQRPSDNNAQPQFGFRPSSQVFESSGNQLGAGTFQQEGQRHPGRSSGRLPSGNLRPSGNSRPALTPSSPEVKAVLEAIQEVGLDISFNQWAEGNTGNVVLSPLSIASLLSLILLASRGESYAQLKRTLHYSNNMTDDAIHEAFGVVLNSIESSEGMEISISSRLFLLTGLPIKGQFTALARDAYGSKVRGVNFAGSPKNAMDVINNWVERSTKGKIKDIITRPFHPDTKFVAANAIFLDGDWEYPFDPRLTQDGTFFTGTRNITLPMMTNIIRVPYINGEEIEMISLPYKGGKYSMVIITPKTYRGHQSLQTVEYYLQFDVLDRLIKSMRTQSVTVKMPRMKLRNKISLKSSLQSLGTTDIFDCRKADLGRITSSSGMCIGDVIHEAVLEISETGTVAAAVSLATFDRMGGGVFFFLDRPSLIFIRDNSNGLPLFSARVTEPEYLEEGSRKG